MRRGVYLLPNLFTTGGLFAGFFAIIAAIHDKPVQAAVAVLVAGLLDGLDGRIARLTNTQSDFGAVRLAVGPDQLGMAPALLIYIWSLAALREYRAFIGKVGFAAAFLYAACAALRLARFNTQVGVADKRFFGRSQSRCRGLVVTFVWTCHEFGLTGGDVVWLSLLLMQCRPADGEQFPLLQLQDAQGGRPGALPLGHWCHWASLSLLAIDLPRHLFILALLYVVSGPVWTLWNLRRNRHRRRRPQVPPPS